MDIIEGANVSDVLFTVTEDTLETGLRGVPVGYCTTSKVDPQKGLHYVGLPIHELSDKDPEEVIFLLVFKRFPRDAAELKEFTDDLKSRWHCRERVWATMRALPTTGHPMKWFIHVLNALGMETGSTGDYREDALNIIANLPLAVAGLFRLRAGWGEPIAPNPELGYIENFVHMLGVPGLDEAGTATLTRLMRVFEILHLDHGGGNLSTFSGKAVASGAADMYESLVGAMAALAGPKHGKANQECLEFVNQCLKEVDELTEEGVAKMVRQRLNNKQLIFGFGHAVLRVEDPRATVFCDLGDELCPETDTFKMVQLLRKVVPGILMENPKISNPYPNVDLASGSLLTSCGLTDPEYYTVLFGMSRCVGIAIQIVYERQEARLGKGTPIIRPKYIYSPTGSSEAPKEG
jgi:citrate synthase